MATDQRNLPAFLSNDADFRTWGAGISAQLAAMGLVKVTGAGEIDHATSVRPAINTFNSKSGGTNGYEIWRFADSLQATVPVFIKLEYGIGAVADRPALAYTVGSTHDGSGTLGGQLGTRKLLAVQVSKTAGIQLASYCSGSTDRLSMVTNMDSGNSSFSLTMVIERPKDGTGTSTADGVVTLGHASSLSVQSIPASGAVPAQSSISCFARMNANGQTSNLGGNVAVCPHLAFFGNFRYGTSLGYAATDIGALASFTMTHMGSTHTYMPIGTTGQAPNPSDAYAILWE